MRYFEDVLIGDRISLGRFHFTPDVIITFAKQFDPQPFHLSEEAGRGSLFGGLAASGWQTASVWMKLMVAHVKAEIADGAPIDAMGPSPGFQDLKWLLPVLAGDYVSYTSCVTEKRPLASQPDWGLVSGIGEGFNQRDKRVISLNYHVFVRRSRRDESLSD